MEHGTESLAGDDIFSLRFLSPQGEIREVLKV